MMNNDLESIWSEIEQLGKGNGKNHFRLVYVDLLFRAYIGVSGVPAKRYLSIEIPETEKEKIESFAEPQGLTIRISEPIVKHPGYVACILQATASDLNDVFTFVAQDVLEELSRQREDETYVKTLIARINKWKQFFKNGPNNLLSDEKVLGLVGELSFIRDSLDHGLFDLVDNWNGPVRAAQDFQGKTFAVEVKATSAKELEYVHISSEAQLDNSGKDVFILAAYKVKKESQSGISLPDLVTLIAEQLKEKQKGRFFASLLCLGFSMESADLYPERFSIEERRFYNVLTGFPRIIRADLPNGISDVYYGLHLQHCDAFLTDMESIAKAIKENEYGEG